MNQLEANRWPVFVVVLLMYWAIGFYPYHLPPYHNGGIRTVEQGLRFDTPGIACKHTPPAWLPTAIAASALRVSLEVKAAPTQTSRWARIFGLSKHSHDSNLAIIQNGVDLIVYLRTPDTNQAGRPGYEIDAVFARPGWRRIELNVLPRLLTVTVDGREVVRQTLPPEPLSNWSPEHGLALGNDLGFSRPWLGELRRASVRVAGQDYDYTLPDALETPASYPLPLANRYIQWIPFSDLKGGRSANVDMAVNLIGLIPFGWFLAMTLRGPRSLLAFAAIACAMSLSIESGQVLLAPRTPSIDDVLLNTLGGALGAWLGLRAFIRRGYG